MSGISIHAPRMGSDGRLDELCRDTIKFQSTLPGWEATGSKMHHACCGNISIHAPRMGSDGRRRARAGTLEISIHAPRMGSDYRTERACPSTPVFQSTLPGWEATDKKIGKRRNTNISIHAPRMGSDPNAERIRPGMLEFQSTLPGWEATTRSRPSTRHRPYFNPRSPDGKRPSRLGEHHRHAFISIHAPRMGSDCRIPYVWRRPEISIHAPRMGSDRAVSPIVTLHRNFNPRSPDGKRRP